MDCFAAYAKDEEVRKKGSSGGVFPVISKAFILKDGIVYASVYDEELNVAFKRIDSESELEESFGSKYMQSRVGGIFKQVEKDLKEQRRVLFCGTPCQAMGLRKYLNVKKISTDNVLIIDFICHGVPSEDVFHKSMDCYYEHKCVTLNMRNKDMGWDAGSYSWKMTFADGSEKNVIQREVPYMRGFLANFYLRPSCYNCVARKNSGADITLGDFWGITRLNNPDICTKRGVSCVILRTEKGKNAFFENAESLNLFGVSYNDILQGNSCLEKSVKLTYYRKAFYKKFPKVPMGKTNELIASFIKPNFSKRVLQKVYSKLPYPKMPPKDLLNKQEKTVFQDKKNCCGCSSCFAICSKGAISMKKDVEGFLYPVINFEKCTNCGLCFEVCPFVAR